MKRGVRCSIVDDHQLLRECLVEKLGFSGEIEVVGAWGTGAEYLAQLPTAEVDVALIDLNLPDIPGTSLLRQSSDLRPDIALVALTMWDHTRYVVEAMQAGARGYVAKGSPFDELIAAILAVASGQTYICKDLARRLKVQSLYNRGDQTVHDLSFREFEVFCSLGQGKSQKQCAADLGISDKTVSTYRARIMEKLNLTSQAELIRLALTVDADTARA